MHYEVRNILIYLYSGGRHVLKGRWKQSHACFRGAFYRTLEMFKDNFRSKKVTCNFCGWQGSDYRTMVATIDIRHHAICPRCLSLERHREFLTLFKKVRALFSSREIHLLDIAPNKAFSDYCQNATGIEYLSIDIQSQLAMRHMDIQNLELPDESFDIIVSYHVLDYVDDDSKGLAEIYRTLKSDGIAIIQEGIEENNAKTIEFGNALPENQYRIRQYGREFTELLARANFNIFAFQPHPDRNQVFLITKKTNPISASFSSLFTEKVTAT